MEPRNNIHQSPDTLLIKHDTILLIRVQDALAIDAFSQIRLGLLAQFIVLQGDLTHELEVLFKLSIGAAVIVVELHAADAGLVGRAGSEAGHAAAVDVQGADGKEVQEQPIIRLLGIGNVLREVAVVAH